MNPRHNGQLCCSQIGRPDIEVQTVFTGDGRFREKRVKRWKIWWFWRCWAILERVTHPAPGFNWLWWLESIGAKGGSRVGNPLKRVHAFIYTTAHFTATGFDDCVHNVSPSRCQEQDTSSLIVSVRKVYHLNNMRRNEVCSRVTDL